MQRLLTYFSFILLIITGCSREPDPVIEGKVIVLMYHRISEGTASNIYERSVADFEADLQYLKEQNIRVIGFDELDEMITGGTVPETHCAILTFDDGDHSWITRAMPLLLKYEMKATFFLWTEMILLERDSFLSWDEVEYMSHYMDDNGRLPFVFGSHTLYHQYLLDRKLAMNDPEAYAIYLDEELGGSRNLIEAHIPGSVTILSLPFGNGAGDPDIIAGALRNGYKFIRTSEWGALDPVTANKLRIPSLPVLSDTNIGIINTYLDSE